MHWKKFLIAASFAFLCASIASPLGAQDLKSVLDKLDKAAASFRSASADFEYEIVVTDPVPETDIQKGSIYYSRKGKSFESGVHINQVDGKPVPKVIIFSRGVVKLFDKLPNQVTTIQKAGKYEGYLALGFGASGKDLTDKFHVKYLGPETISGVNTDKLELVAKDPSVLKYFPKITIWIDPTRSVSLKQVFDEGQGQSRTATYSNIKLNQALPSDAFTFKTDGKTTYINR
jgi:outer membrane lipoprotein-sorting protein